MKKRKWVKLVEREADFWKNYMMFSSIGDVKKVFDCTIAERLTTRRGAIFTHWLNPKAVWNTGLQIESKIKNDPQFVKKLTDEFSRSKRKLLKQGELLEKIEYQKLSNRGLLEAYQRFCGVYQGLYAAFHLTVYIDSLESKTKKWLKSKLKKTGEEDRFNTYYRKLTTPTRNSLLQEEELALLEIAIKSKKQKSRNKKFQGLLNRHLEKFAGLPVVNEYSKPWTREYFLKRLKELRRESLVALEKKHKRDKNYPEQVKKEQEKLRKKLSLPKLIWLYFVFIRESIWIRLTSRNIFALAHYSSRKLFKEIGRRHRLTREDVKWFMPKEVSLLILQDKSPKKQKFKERKQASVLLFRKGRYNILEGQAAENFMKNELGTAVEDIKNFELKGAVAYPGKVEGAVKILLKQTDIMKMEKGDVLISRMTTPELTPAIKKAAAIVTDEGGITCHAAIVSRELRIPCVVGTKLASRIFRDNDRIFVDAYKGVIKKI